MHRILAAIGLLVACAGVRTAPAQEPRYKVIVNANNRVGALSADELSKIFLRNATVWQNGEPVLPVDLSEASPVHEAFVRDVLNKDAAALRAYWQQQIFAGRAVPPPSKTSEEDVLEFVRRYPGAIGYVSLERTIGPQARVVAIVR
jgi:ABC-type phosphate transport system substrate-binding protein